jgi:RNA polymerase sigma-70 factor (ECF subfamily)
MASFSKNGRLDRVPLDQEDRTVILAVMSGDRQAFTLLVKKYQQPIYAAIRRLVRQHEDADDLVQECFVQAYQHLRDFDLNRSFYPWLYRIGINLAISFMRKRKWRSAVDSVDVFPTAEGGPQTQAETQEFYQALENAIAKLPAEQRAILLLRTREDMSYQEMSETLGIEIGTVMSRLARAREKLRTWMRPHLETRTEKIKQKP